jgi:hypothetical protein
VAPGSQIRAATGSGAISRNIEHTMRARIAGCASGNLQPDFIARDFIASVIAVL